MNEQPTVAVNEELTKALAQLNGILQKLAGVPVSTKAKAKPEAKPVKRTIAPNLVAEFEKWFFTAPEDQLYNVKRGQWECKLGDEAKGTAHTLLFHSLLTDKISNASDVVGIRPIGSKLGIFNGSRITYGTSWREQKEPQAIAEACGAVPVPFENVVDKDKGAGLDLSKLTIVEWTGAEKMVIPPISRKRDWQGDFYVVERHFAGAMVIKIEDKYFLFDADREELKCHGFNPFFTQLPKAVQSVEEAYQALAPKAVHDAVQNGKEVIRQGEFFFVEADQDAVRKAVIDRAKGPKQVREFFYDQIAGRLKLYGAAQVNCQRADETREVVEFLKRCKEHSSGFLPETSNKLLATTSLGNYTKFLTSRVGPAKANPPALPKDQDSWGSHWQGQETHMEYLADELASRLDGDPDDEDDFDDNPPARRRNVSVEGVPIRYRMRIGAQDPNANGGRSQNNHLATAVFRRSKNEVYALGSVFHQGREHRPIYLDKWYRVYPNTAVVNWTVSGDVD